MLLRVGRGISLLRSMKKGIADVFIWGMLFEWLKGKKGL
jgi:hypothetical protein